MKRPTVLVVDDDAFSRTVVSKKLKAHANVLEAEDGHDALTKLNVAIKLNAARIDLAIVDLEMPRCNGLELIKSMRDIPQLKHVPIIVLTANETRGGLEGALMSGATSFLLKPLNWSVFGEHIRHVMELAYRAGHMAMHDHLTGLPNRVHYNERLAEALQQAGPGSLVATHMLDLDLFKCVNDTMGHPAGDELLSLVARRLTNIVRNTDTVARMGGDEFAIVQSGLTSPADAAQLAERIIEEVSKPYALSGQRVVIGTTIGISLSTARGNVPAHEMRNADVALYRAKKIGRGSYCFFDHEIDIALHGRNELARDLRLAVTARQFELFYQPMINLASQRIKGFEALIRWKHPVKGQIQPDAFIALAEELGLIVEIGEWVIEEACVAAQKWPGDLTVSVNLSPDHFKSPGLRSAVVQALAKSGLKPQRLELEITEANLLNNSDATLTALHELRQLGVRIAMDDFGTGYSSLRYLQSFPFDRIKIDQSFVGNVTDSEGSRKIVRAVAAVAHGLGIDSTAEGVETPEQLAAILANGCTEVQGFLSGRPLPADEVALMLLKEQIGRPEEPAAPIGKAHIAA